jgi:putative ABC transport system permease protein
VWRQLVRGLHALTDRAGTDRNVADEVDDYLENARAAHLARGLSPEQALRAARIEVGGVTNVREQVRGYGWENAVEMVLVDARYACRRFRSNSGFTVITVITLAIGIGASTAIFSAVNSILFESLPYPHANRVATISDFSADGTPLDVTFGTYRELAQRSHSFDALAVLNVWQPTLLGDGEPERLEGQRAGGDYFRALGVPPMLGRNFTASDDRAGGPRVVILSNSLWRRRFSGNRDIIGRAIRLNDEDYVVIGVMPARFENVVAPSVQISAPLQYNTVFGPDSREWGHHLRMIGRLRAGVGITQARDELDAIARTPRTDFPRVPWALLQKGLLVHSLQDEVTGGVKPVLLAVLGAVILVLLIACANVTNLLLASGARRRGEFAMRAALGARRNRLTQQLLTESLMLALVGGALGMVVAELGVRALVVLSPAGLPRASAIHLDAAVFAFGLLVTTLVGVSVGVIPALRASRAELTFGVQQASQRTTGGNRITREVLVVAEVALAVVLLVGAGLLLRSIRDLLAVNVGFDPSHVLTMQIQESGQRFQLDSANLDSARYDFFAEALDAVQKVPGVTAAAFTSQLPLSGDFAGYGVHFDNDPDANAGGSALEYAVSPSYFATMRIPLRRGRLLGAQDRSGAPRSALINESFARRQFPNRDAIGQQLDFGPADGQRYTIVGVVGDVKQSSLSDGETDAIYITPTQWHWVENPMSLVVRTRGDAAALAPAIRRAIHSVDRNQPVLRVATMTDLVDRSVADRHFALVLFEAFGLVALLLAAVGIYGVLSSSVTEKVREIGIRAALGASPESILALVLGQGMRLTAIGIASGLAAAAAATRAIVSMLFGVSRLDAITYLAVVVTLSAVAGIACGVPALRAARLDPNRALRAG